MSDISTASNSDRTKMLRTDIELLQQCANMDSIDKHIWQPPLIGILMLDLLQQHKSVTYGNMLYLIDSMRNTTSYREARAACITVVLPARTTIEASGSDAEEKKPYTFLDFVSLDDCKSTANSDHKDILLYFSGHNNAMARKMEQKVFSNEQVKETLQTKYVSYVLYTDDNTSMPRKGGTVGDYVASLEEKLFNANAQPFIVILDSSGKKLRTTTYTSKAEDFLSFLR